MADTEHYDALLIGAGQSGMPLSRAMSRAGWKTAMLERAHVGGTCINTGCTPTRTMIASARVAYLTGRAAEYGVRVSPPSVATGRTLPPATVSCPTSCSHTRSLAALV